MLKKQFQKGLERKTLRTKGMKLYHLSVYRCTFPELSKFSHAWVKQSSAASSEQTVTKR